MKQPHFLHVDTNSQKLKVDCKSFVWAWSKMGVANLVSGLNLNISREWTDGINWFFACWHKFTQIKKWLKIFWVGMVEHGCKKFGDETLKLTVFEDWTDGINWFYACWCRLTKIKCWSKISLGGHGQKWVWLIWSQDLKLIVPQKWTDGINWFFVCWHKFKLEVVSVIFGWAWSKMTMAF